MSAVDEVEMSAVDEVEMSAVDEVEMRMRRSHCIYYTLTTYRI